MILTEYCPRCDKEVEPITTYDRESRGYYGSEEVYEEYIEEYCPLCGKRI